MTTPCPKWSADYKRYVDGKIVCHCDENLDPRHFTSRRAGSNGHGFYSCAFLPRKCQFWAWSGINETGSEAADTELPPNLSPMNHPALPPSSPSHQVVSSFLPSSTVSISRMSREEMRDKITSLTARLQEKEEQLKVAMRWKQEAEDKLEDMKDRLRDILTDS